MPVVSVALVAGPDPVPALVDAAALGALALAARWLVPLSWRLDGASWIVPLLAFAGVGPTKSRLVQRALEDGPVSLDELDDPE